MYVYSGFDLVRNPTGWLWAVPFWFSDLVQLLMPLEQFLRIQGGVELALALIFFLWFLPRKIVLVASAISSLEIAGILFFAPFSQFLITFRDLGVLGASFALFLVTLQKYGPERR